MNYGLHFLYIFHNYYIIIQLFICFYKSFSISFVSNLILLILPPLTQILTPPLHILNFNCNVEQEIKK